MLCLIGGGWVLFFAVKRGCVRSRICERRERSGKTRMFGGKLLGWSSGRLEIRSGRVLAWLEVENGEVYKSRLLSLNEDCKLSYCKESLLEMYC